MEKKFNKTLFSLVQMQMDAAIIHEYEKIVNNIHHKKPHRNTIHFEHQTSFANFINRMIKKLEYDSPRKNLQLKTFFHY